MIGEQRFEKKDRTPATLRRRRVTAPRCELCWEEFESEIDLLFHEAAEDDRIYYLDGVGDQGPGGGNLGGSIQSKSHRPPSDGAS